MLTPTWNGIAASVRCVSSIPVTLNTIMAVSCGARTQTKEDDEKQRKPKTVMLFPKRNTNITLLLQFWLCMRWQVYYICFNDLCRLIKKYIYVSEKAPIYMLLAAEHQNAVNLALQTYKKTSGLVLWQLMVGDLSSRNLLLTEVPLKKFPFL